MANSGHLSHVNTDISPEKYIPSSAAQQSNKYKQGTLWSELLNLSQKYTRASLCWLSGRIFLASWNSDSHQHLPLTSHYSRHLFEGRHAQNQLNFVFQKGQHCHDEWNQKDLLKSSSGLHWGGRSASILWINAYNGLAVWAWLMDWGIPDVTENKILMHVNNPWIVLGVLELLCSSK